MGFEDDLRRIDEHIADARRMVHEQKGLIIRLLGAGAASASATSPRWLTASLATSHCRKVLDKI